MRQVGQDSDRHWSDRAEMTFRCTSGDPGAKQKSDLRAVRSAFDHPTRTWAAAAQSHSITWSGAPVLSWMPCLRSRKEDLPRVIARLAARESIQSLGTSDNSWARRYANVQKGRSRLPRLAGRASRQCWADLPPRVKQATLVISHWV